MPGDQQARVFSMSVTPPSSRDTIQTEKVGQRTRSNRCGRLPAVPGTQRAARPSSLASPPVAAEACRGSTCHSASSSRLRSRLCPHRRPPAADRGPGSGWRSPTRPRDRGIGGGAKTQERGLVVGRRSWQNLVFIDGPRQRQVLDNSRARPGIQEAGSATVGILMINDAHVWNWLSAHEDQGLRRLGPVTAGGPVNENAAR
jgi:hypothetical protein